MLVTAIFLDLGFAALKALGKYAATVLVGLFVHGFVTLPILVLVMGRHNPFRLFNALSPALMTAWSTASSAATLPMTMSNLENRAGVEGRIGNFVLPLGATINTVADKEGNLEYIIRLRDSFVRGGISTLAEAIQIAKEIIEENQLFIEKSAL